MNANLISDTSCFLWEDLSIDRSHLIEDLIIAQKFARDGGDIMYSSPELLNIALSWGHLYELTNRTFAEIYNICPWLNREYQVFLARLINGNPTPGNARSLNDLHAEFPQRNNSWYGLAPKDQPRYVHDEQSWKTLHQENIYEFYRGIDKESEYFKKHYKARLTISAGSLKKIIEKKQDHKIFERLDIPTVIENDQTLHGEQIQMHFNDQGKSALNLDGEWKHGGFDIPRKARLKLIEWGFKVPRA